MDHYWMVAKYAFVAAGAAGLALAGVSGFKKVVELGATSFALGRMSSGNHISDDTDTIEETDTTTPA